MRLCVFRLLWRGMALRDLIADKSSFDEAAIERVVTPYLRYDTEAQEFTFLSPFAGLSNKAKILVYLVGLQGWRFVSDEPVASDARPADIEAATGIPGGSVRPVLRELCDNHVLVERGGSYSVRATSLPTVEAEVAGAAVRPVQPSRRKGNRPKQRAKEAATEEEFGADAGIARVGPKRGRKTGVGPTFDKWIDEGYFDEPKTLAEVQNRFRKEAIIVPQTSLPGYFLGAVRNKRLKREEITVGNKTVWAYTTNKAAE
jgi:hypothetical protein